MATTFATLARKDLGKLLRQYHLPDGVLPLAPQRIPFSHFGDEALTAAAAWVLRHPEKRGMISYAIRSMLGSPIAASHKNTATIEAHLDGRDLTQPVEEGLLRLGFELDGFVSFNPAHFNAHYTFKVKTAVSANSRRAELAAIVRDACDRALSLLVRSNVEAYIELEAYRCNQRRTWGACPLLRDWRRHFPLDHASLKVAVPACTDVEARERNLPLGYGKRADIHIKISKAPGDGSPPSELLEALCGAGFYHVVTWAGNDVCTAQFRRGRDAKRIFDVLEDFINRCGGASEMTLEPSPATWRSEVNQNGERRLAALPPLVLEVDPPPLSFGRPS
jgi:hypothetical protein